MGRASNAPTLQHPPVAGVSVHRDISPASTGTSMDVPVVPDDGPSDEGRAATVASVLDGAFVSSMIGMPCEDPRDAVDVLWASFEALVAAHFQGSLPGKTAVGVSDSTHWSRVLVTAVTNGVMLCGGFIRPGEAVVTAEEILSASRHGRLWNSRRPSGLGAVVLAAHSALLRLTDTVDADRRPGPQDLVALRDLVALAAVGAVLSEEASEQDGVDPRSQGVDPAVVDAEATAVADAFGIPEVRLVPVTRTGWVCDECGCFFGGRVVDGMAYPDRLAPVGRAGPCGSATLCRCHRAPLQRRVDAPD